MKRWVPHPILSIVLCVVWVLLSNEVAVGSVLVGAVLGLILPHVTRALWPGVRIQKPRSIVRYLAVFLFDVIVANLQVAVLVLGPENRRKPAFIEYPLQLTDEWAIIVLGCTISVTPGTVTVDVDMTRRRLLIHCVNVPDPSDVVERIRKRYDNPLMEIFP
ncbi:MAG: Na+/H+ antiporter subunit E [Desulfosoma sp.]|uniref:Na+/H+ antiporter subunit E n=1 Tax=Desulfosoma sp. TaxID=2603217 RepID=UPI00404966C3